MQRPLLTGLFALLLAAPLSAQEKKFQVQMEKDLIYGKGGQTELKLDLAMPKDGAGPFPAVVCVHGGGWRGGSRTDLTKTIEMLAGRGFVAVAVTYRLVPTAAFPAQIEDCKASVRWLRANAKKYKIDPDRIGAIGMSAGGHLVSLLGTTVKEDGLEGSGGNAEFSSGVQAVISFFGPSDLSERTWNPDLEKALIEPLVGGPFADRPELFKKASPVTYVRKGAPPFLLFHGTADKVVPVSQSRILAEKLKAAGASVKLVEIEGADHGWAGPKLLETIEQSVKFLEEQLKKEQK